MTRYIPTVLLCLALVWGATACAPKPKLVGPTPTKGYFVSLQVLNSSIFVASSMLNTEQVPRTAELVVRMQNVQGQPIDDVPVVFDLTPDWNSSASVTPPNAITRDGMVRAIFEADDIGVAPVTVRVNGVTQAASISVSQLGNAVR